MLVVVIVGEFSHPEKSSASLFPDRGSQVMKLPQHLYGNDVFWLSDSRRSNQSILKEINPEYLLEGLMLKLKLQYFGHLVRRANLLEKILMLGKIESRRKRG